MPIILKFFKLFLRATLLSAEHHCESKILVELSQQSFAQFRHYADPQWHPSLGSVKKLLRHELRILANALRFLKHNN